ncbi:DUF2201 family putative metallopeptidase [Thermus oshimai]|uniref:vWA domain-containing protein n=1 Tax=Thermus oshimai TaxID=56957 RepID=UPI0002E550E5|nr:VWA-like domain-containing protein [Thermus oshimai]
MVRERLRRLRLRLLSDHPFFGTLLLHAPLRETPEIPTMATDGYAIYYNPSFVEGLTDDEILGVLLHEALHAAYAHLPRRGSRDPLRWNVAADIVVNGIVDQEGVGRLPEGALRDPALQDFPVEEVYALLPETPSLPNPDLLEEPPSHYEPLDEEGFEEGGDGGASGAPGEEGHSGTGVDPEGGGSEGEADSPNGERNGVGDRDSEEGDGAGSGGEGANREGRGKGRAAGGEGKGTPNVSRLGRGQGTPGVPGKADALGKGVAPGSGRGQGPRPANLQDYWRRALREAQVAVETAYGSKSQGRGALGASREYRQAVEGRLDWRALLWRFLTPTPTDFGGLDRRFIHQGLYLEALEEWNVRVHIAVDTSGSIGSEHLSRFLGEVQAILRAYPRTQALLYYADAKLYGPYPLEPEGPWPGPRGGGGTDFRPFFRHLEGEDDPLGEILAVYLTDGFGNFPETPPRFPVLWVVTPGGLEDEGFPFGEVARLWD